MSFDVGAQLGSTPIATLPAFPASVTAVAIAPSLSHAGNHVLAVGLEDGSLDLVGLRISDSELVSHETLWRASVYEAHAGAVRRLCWRTCGYGDSDAGVLASCSDDHSFKIFEVAL